MGVDEKPICVLARISWIMPSTTASTRQPIRLHARRSTGYVILCEKKLLSFGAASLQGIIITPT